MAAAHAPRRTDWAGVGMYLLAGLLFSVNGVLSKQGMAAGLSAQQWTAMRSFGALPLLGIALLATRPASLRITRAEIPFLAAYGFIAFALVHWLYFETITHMGVGEGTLLIFLAPVVTALYLRVFRHVRVGARLWVAIALAIGGLALVSGVWQGSTWNPVGVVAGLACAVALASYWLLGESGQQRRDPVSLTFWGFAFASALWAVVVPPWTLPWAVLTGPSAPFANGTTVPVIAIVAWTVVMGTIAPFLLVLGALRRLGAQRAGIVGTSEPLIAAAVAAALIGESVTAVQAVGGLVVVAGIVLAETARRPVSDPERALPSPA